MKKVFIFFIFLPSLATYFFSCGSNNKHQLAQLWETDTVFKIPESVLYDSVEKVLYVSNIDGTDTWANDGKGAISKMGADGKNIVVDWVDSLNAPKGMGIYNGKLYAADPKDLVVIDIKSGTIEKRIAIPGAVGLNDISIDKDGVVYLSDSEGKKIYKVVNDSAQVILDKLDQPNGVLVYDNNFYLLNAGAFYKMNADRSLAKLAEGMEGGTDGVEHVSGMDFIISTWDGVVYYVYADGKKEKLLDTRSKGIKSADIGYDGTRKIVYVPTFFRNSVVAYEVK